MKRASGVLLPVTALPTKYGIGGFSKDAYEFVDFLADAAQSYWQILPLGPTGYGDSPYQSFSTFAGSPLLISLEKLCEEGLLTEEECASYDATGESEEYIDYEKLSKTRFKVLRIAADRFRESGDLTDFESFREKQREWLEEYCLYSVIKERQQQKNWSLWPEELRDHKEEVLAKVREEAGDDLFFYAFLQYEFFSQWKELKAYANGKGIEIIGDIPIYVAMDSADAWAEPLLFQFDDQKQPLGVAGCPPDAFSATGQLWGNPLYDWDYHRKTGYSWWIRRLRHMQEICDVVRIDHFRGFNDYWSIPYGDTTAENGHWEKGPGLEPFEILERENGEVRFIAEDLGMLTDEVREMVAASGFPGMKILEFAFDGDDKNLYLPHNYEPNCIVYTGTHDNDTVLGWLKTIPESTKKHLDAYAGKIVTKAEDVIRLGMSSVAKICIIPMQDWLELDGSARVNTPNTLGENWKWRLLDGQMDDKTAGLMRHMTELYSRQP